VIHQGKILGFDAEDPATGQRYFFLPGGAIEDQETPSDCAVREAFEETGYRVRLIPGAECIKKYDFEWNGNLYECTTYFFLGSLASDARTEVHDSTYHLGVVWLSLDEIKNALSYSKEIYDAVAELIAREAHRQDF